MSDDLLMKRLRGQLVDGVSMMPYIGLAAADRIAALEAALREAKLAIACGGSTMVVIARVTAALDSTSETVAEPRGTDSKCPHGFWKAYCDLCILGSAENRGGVK